MDELIEIRGCAEGYLENAKYHLIHSAYEKALSFANMARDEIDYIIKHCQPTPLAGDEFSGHADNCVLRSGGYACTCSTADAKWLASSGAYMQGENLGTRCIISGGEVMEIG